MAGLLAGVSAVRFLCLQSIIYGGYAIALVQSTGFGGHGRCSQKTSRYSYESGAVDECDVVSISCNAVSMLG